MNLWYEALTDVNSVESDSNAETLTVDQRLKIAEIKALLAIGQDLNALRLNDHEAFS